jgi:hypothetical protein
MDTQSREYERALEMGDREALSRLIVARTRSGRRHEAFGLLYQIPPDDRASLRAVETRMWAEEISALVPVATIAEFTWECALPFLALRTFPAVSRLSRVPGRACGAQPW